MRELLRDLLESEGFRVYLAPGGREALSLFAVQQFDGVFTDVGMPGMSGWELAHAIRQSNESIPIAVITGWGEAVGSDEQKQARVDWVITKPFRAERISELAQEITKKSSIAKRAPFQLSPRESNLKSASTCTVTEDLPSQSSSGWLHPDFSRRLKFAGQPSLSLNACDTRRLSSHSFLQLQA